MEQEVPPPAVKPSEELLPTWPPGHGRQLLSFLRRRRAQRTHGRRAAWSPVLVGSALLVGPFGGLPWPIEPQRAHAQQVSQPQIKVVPSIVARAQSQVVLPIEIGPAEALPKKSFISVRGLPPSVTLTEGHLITAGSWAVSLADLGTLKAYIPVGFSGRAEIDIKLIAFDGRMLGQTKTTLVVEPSDTPRASGATREKGRAPASQPPGLSGEQKQRAERMLAQGEEYLTRGSILVARQFFQRAADTGLAAAALRMAATYDAVELERMAVSGVVGDRDLAQRWYERATELGSPDAEERSARLRAYDFYEGKTVNIVINLSAGGSTGVLSQLFGQYWSAYIPGNPKFIVTPVEGDEQLRGITRVRDSQPDGLTLGWVSWSAATRQIGPASERVDWTQFEVIGGMGAQALAYMRSDVRPGIKKAEDILKAERVQVGGYRSGSYFDLQARMSLDILGVRHGYTTGFGGGAKIIAALQRNEVNFAATPAANYFASIEQDVVKEGIGLPLWYYAFTGENGELVIDRAFGDIRPFHEVVESATGKPPSGPLWEALKWLNDTSAGVTWLIATPRGVAEDRLAVLRHAFFKAAEDPQFLEQAKHVATLAPPITSTQGMNRIIGRVRKVDPQIVSILQNYIKSGSQ